MSEVTAILSPIDPDDQHALVQLLRPFRFTQGNGKWISGGGILHAGGDPCREALTVAAQRRARRPAWGHQLCPA